MTLPVLAASSKATSSNSADGVGDASASAAVTAVGEAAGWARAMEAGRVTVAAIAKASALRPRLNLAVLM
ncbi:hypothetical protein GCM10010363_74960 [Streptomyces omiyaensis]|nr:hypothetical protein GCM10010363_74960 [Streptomyces omiyaensis]